MIVHPNTWDAADKVMLTHAMMKYNDGTQGLAPDCIGRIDRVAKYAAQALVDLVEVDKNWDGVLWYERLEAIGANSLARALLILARKEFGPGQPATNPFEESGYAAVSGVVKIWMVTHKIPVSDQRKWL